MATLEFNTAIAALIELNNRLTQVVAEQGSAPEEVVARAWCSCSRRSRRTSPRSCGRGSAHESRSRSPTSPSPTRRCSSTTTVEIPVQVNGKVRGRVTRRHRRRRQREHEAAARADAKVAELLEGATVRKVVVVPGRMVNFVVG